ncbi:hypothetical protein SC29R_11500 [Aggregatibacter actinomycetemcomitans serotype f str. SC29R]|nr:hypothetical protein SC29R_11500 [Aggregatibacter actinomycetemcomitans serotype f str. SC29R]
MRLFLKVFLTDTRWETRTGGKKNHRSFISVEYRKKDLINTRNFLI